MIPLTVSNRGTIPSGRAWVTAASTDAKVVLHGHSLDARIRIGKNDTSVRVAWRRGHLGIPRHNADAFGGDGKAKGYLYGRRRNSTSESFFFRGNSGPQFDLSEASAGAKGSLFIASEDPLSGGLFFFILAAS